MRPWRKYRDLRQVELGMKPIDDVIASSIRSHNSFLIVARHGRRRMKEIEQASQAPFADFVGVSWDNPVYQLHFIESEDVVDETGLKLWQE